MADWAVIIKNQSWTILNHPLQTYDTDHMENERWGNRYEKSRKPFFFCDHAPAEEQN